MEKIKLNKKQQAVIRPLHESLVLKKCLIANLTADIKYFQSKIDVLLKEINVENNNIAEKAKEIATDLNIDFEGENFGKWSLNTEDMMFIKS